MVNTKSLILYFHLIWTKTYQKTNTNKNPLFHIYSYLVSKLKSTNESMITSIKITILNMEVKIF
jgi:hypothetical protein